MALSDKSKTSKASKMHKTIGGIANVFKEICILPSDHPRDAEDVVPYNNKDSTNKQSNILTNQGNTKKILTFGKYTQTY